MLPQEEIGTDDWFPCERESIHTPGHIQSHGVLLTCDRTGRLLQCSSNTERLLGRDARPWLGQPLSAYLPIELVNRIEARFTESTMHQTHESETIELHQRRWSLCCHQTRQCRIIEFIPIIEPISVDLTTILKSFSDLTYHLASPGSITDFAETFVQKFRAISGYDRVMVYRFDERWNGEVIAEARANDVEPFLGLWFPASDIPSQARDLYTEVELRVLVDGRAPSSPIIPRQLPDSGEELDLRHARLRALAPIHAEYLQNMGVSATLVVSIRLNDRLWGLFACHHRTMFQPSNELIGVAENWSRMLGNHVAVCELIERNQTIAKTREVLANIARCTEAKPIEEALVAPETQLMETLHADGLVVVHRGIITSRGLVPDRTGLTKLLQRFNREPSRYTITSKISELFPEISVQHPEIGGMLAMRLPNTTDSWIMWFRATLTTTVRWAGDPRKHFETIDGLTRLTPRRSFTAWLETMSGMSREWTPTDRLILDETLRQNLAEIIALGRRREVLPFQAYHSIILEQINDAVIITDLDNRVQFWNSGATRLFGWNRNDMLGQPLDARYPIIARQRYHDIVQRVRAGELFSNEQADTHKDGTAIWVDMQAQLVHNEHGQPIGLIWICRDVTERKRAIQELHRSQSFLQSTGAMAKVGGWEISFLDQQLYWTEETYHIHDLPLTMKPAVDQAIQFYAEHERPKLIRSLEHARLHHTGFEGEYEFISANQQHKWVHVICFPVLEDGVAVGLRGTFQDITERKQTEAALQQSISQYHLVANAIQDIVGVLTADGECEYISPSCQRVLGFSPAELIHSHWSSFAHSDDSARITDSFQRCLQGQTVRLEWRCRHRDGHFVWMESVCTPATRTAGEQSHMVICTRDISERKNLEEQFRQAQKLEAFGQLAGGIAHDFNNILTVVIGCSEMLVQQTGNATSEMLAKEVLKAGERGASLTRQLLTFSRKQILKVELIDLNRIIADLTKMLNRLLNEDIRLLLDLHPHLGHIRADSGQIEQILVNLAVNARDAMPQGGQLMLATQAVHIAHYESGFPNDLQPGSYISLTVSDTGVGMTEETRSRIFEPFFTTKPTGKGTGLGLATVYGIMKQSGGSIRVQSTRGVGSTFELLFPRVGDDLPLPVVATPNPEPVPGAMETILVVEDETAVRELTTEILVRASYRVITASNGVEAIRLAEQHGSDIHLVLTDVVMPEMGGRELYEILTLHRPTLKVIFLSGYTEDAILRYGIAHDRVVFMQKPYNASELTRLIRKTLDET